MKFLPFLFLAVSVQAQPVRNSQSNSLITGPFSVNGSTPTGGLVVTGSGTYVYGVTDGKTGLAGYVGEISTGVPAATVQLAATTVLTVLSSMTLTPGTWDITGGCIFSAGGTTAETDLACAITSTAGGGSGTTTADTSTADSRSDMDAAASVSTLDNVDVGPRRVSIMVNTNYYLAGAATFSTLGGATWTTNSMIRATRIR